MLKLQTNTVEQSYNVLDYLNEKYCDNYSYTRDSEYRKASELYDIVDVLAVDCELRKYKQTYHKEVAISLQMSMLHMLRDMWWWSSGAESHGMMDELHKQILKRYFKEVENNF